MDSSTHCRAFGNEKLVKLLLEKGNSPAYVRNKEGHSTLHIAAKEGNVEVMKELITACPDIYEMLDNRGRTALHLAAESGEEAVVEFFLKRPSEKRAFAFLPKIAKFFKGWIIVEFFKRKAKYFKYVKEKVDSSWIIVEFFKRKANCFKYVKEKVDSTHNGTKSNERGEENAKFIQELYKGLINEQDEEGNTPMHLAAIEGHYNLAFQLKDGASQHRFIDLNARNKEGFATMDNLLLKMKLKSWITVCPFCPYLLNTVLLHNL